MGADGRKLSLASLQFRGVCFPSPGDKKKGGGAGLPPSN